MGTDCGIIWRTYTKYVDIDTGEEITKHNFKTNYYHISTKKHGTLNANKSKGTIEYTIIGRQKPKQTTLFDETN